MFEKFSDQVYMSSSYIIEKIEDDGTYVLVHADSEARESWSKLSFKVQVDKDEEDYKCVCKLFEHMGILCCHVIKVRQLYFGPCTYIFLPLEHASFFLNCFTHLP